MLNFCFRKPCLPCKTYFPTEISLATHNGQKHKKKCEIPKNGAPVKCQYCSQFSLTSFNLRKHCLIHHKKEMEKDWLKCSICSILFQDNEALQRHVKQMHKAKDVDAERYSKCDYCDKRFHKAFPARMYEHCSSIHTTQIVSHWIICALCGIYFPPDKIDKHLKGAHKEKFYEKIQCIYCPRQICGKGSYAKHGNAYHPEEVSKDWHMCSMCSKFYPTLSDLKNHKENHSLIQCPYCTIRKLTKERHQNHLLSCHYQEARTNCSICNICKKMFATEDQKKQHYCSQSPTEEMQCEFCTMRLRSMASYITHANNTHRIEISKQWPNCTTCSRHLPSQTILEKHLCVALKCEFNCQQSFKNKSDLIIHANKMHLDNLKDSSWILCSHCQWFCPNKWFLNYHTRNAHQVDSRKFSCNHCEKKFSWEEYLKVHLKRNHSEKLTKKPVRCSVCKIKHDSIKLLRIHRLKEHPFTEKFSCSHCEKKSISREYLKVHIKLNHSVKFSSEKYICSVCIKMFDSLKVLRTHREEKHQIADKFNCDQCTSIFPGKMSLTLHVKRKHNDSLPVKNFQCLNCFVNFVSIADLQSHIAATNHSSR